MPVTVTHALQSVAREAVPSLCAHTQYIVAIAKPRSVSRSAVFHSSRGCQHLSEQSVYLNAAALSTGCLGQLLHAHGVLASDCRHAQAVHLHDSQQQYLSAVNQRLNSAQLSQKGIAALASLLGSTLQPRNGPECVPSQALSVLSMLPRCMLCNIGTSPALSSPAVSRGAHNAKSQCHSKLACRRSVTAKVSLWLTALRYRC